MTEGYEELGLGREALELAAELVARASGAGMTLATAESCTGGLVSGAITAVSGSSDVLTGGIVSYDSRIKASLLGVSEETLAVHGAVSSECAAQMAEGARRVLKTDVVVSVTGIAGPTGAVPGKPVGTVWFALSREDGTKSLCRQFHGNRREVRLQSVNQALALLIEGVMER